MVEAHSGRTACRGGVRVLCGSCEGCAGAGRAPGRDECPKELIVINL